MGLDTERDMASIKEEIERSLEKDFKLQKELEKDFIKSNEQSNKKTVESL